MPLQIVNRGVVGGINGVLVCLRVSSEHVPKNILGGVSDNVGWGLFLVDCLRRLKLRGVFNDGFGDAFGDLSLYVFGVFEHMCGGCLPQCF